MGLGLVDEAQLSILEGPHLDPGVSRARDQERRFILDLQLAGLFEVLGDPLVLLIGEDPEVPGHAIDGLLMRTDRDYFLEFLVEHNDGPVGLPRCEDCLVLDGAEGEAEGDVGEGLGGEVGEGGLGAGVEVDFLGDGGRGEQAVDGEAPGHLENGRVLLFVDLLAVVGEDGFAGDFFAVGGVEVDFAVGGGDCEQAGLEVVLLVEDDRLLGVVVVEERRDHRLLFTHATIITRQRKIQCTLNLSGQHFVNNVQSTIPSQQSKRWPFSPVLSHFKSSMQPSLVIIFQPSLSRQWGHPRLPMQSTPPKMAPGVFLLGWAWSFWRVFDAVWMPTPLSSMLNLSFASKWTRTELWLSSLLVSNYPLSLSDLQHCFLFTLAQSPSSH